MPLKKPKAGGGYAQPNPSPYPGKALGVGPALGKPPPDLSPMTWPQNSCAPLDPRQLVKQARGLPARRLNVGPGNLG